MNEKVALTIFIFCYFVVTRIIFEYIYNASSLIIDEIFHLPLGIKYCNFVFNEWDNKVTTLPGLYLFSTLLTAPFGACTVYALRYTVFITGLLNIILVFYTRKHWLPDEDIINRLLNTANIVMMPPLWFFSNIYYTDILSMMFVNAMILSGLKGHSFVSSFLGFLAILTRQNNAVYVLFIAGYRVFTHFFDILMKLDATPDEPVHVSTNNKWELRLLKTKFNTFLRHGILTHDYGHLLIDGLCYSVPLMSLALFVYLNGSVVVGDKEAHNATVHLTQIFYFSLFTMFFCWPHVLTHLQSFLEHCGRRFGLTIFFVVSIFLIVKYNTIIHPYLLADNRHYLFYVWSRFLSTDELRQAFSPIYLLGTYILYKFCFRSFDPRFGIVYSLMLLLILCTQSLIDVRYFLTPYVILRSYIAPTTRFDLLVEFICHCVVSVCTLYIFGHKEIYWPDFSEPQRIIW